MKKLLAVLFVAAVSMSSSYANMDRDVTRAAAPSSDKSAAGSKKPNAQEYVDTARTGQSAPTRILDKSGRCRDADGIWLMKEDAGYTSCVKGAKRVEQ